MATHSSTLAWRIPGTEESGGLHVVHGDHRVGHDWAAKHKYKSDLLQKIIALGLLADGCAKFSFLNIK